MEWTCEEQNYVPGMNANREKNCSQQHSRALGGRRYSLVTPRPWHCYLRQRTQIELGVDLGGGKRLMPQHIGNLFESTASSDHLRRQAMAQHMGTWSVYRNSGAPEQFLNEGADADRATERAKRRLPSKEQFAM
jgi:hypothetical protein